jgi:phage baseplate assembly protein V
MLDMMQRVVAPMQRLIANLVSRAVIARVDDAGGAQLMQVTVLADETRDACERLQGYGVTSVPLAGAEALVISVGGRRDHMHVIAVNDERYRKAGLQPGEVAVYSHTGAYILLRANGTIEINAPIDMVAGAVVKVAGNQVVGPRLGAITAPVGGSTIDTQARTAITQIINRLGPSGHGLTS